MTASHRGTEDILVVKSKLLLISCLPLILAYDQPMDNLSRRFVPYLETILCLDSPLVKNSYDIFKLQKSLPSVFDISMGNAVEEGNTYYNYGGGYREYYHLRKVEMFNPTTNQINADEKRYIFLFIKLENSCYLKLSFSKDTINRHFTV